MNTIETNNKLMELYKDNFPQLLKYPYLLPLCQEEYTREDNIKLVFGSYNLPPSYLDISITDVSQLTYIQNKRYKYFRYSPEYYKEEGLKISEDENIQHNFNDLFKFHINSFVNGNRMLNCCEILLHPFNREDNISKDILQEKEQSFLFSQINILQPDALIIYIDDSSDDFFSSSMSETIKNTFGQNTVFYPIPFPPSFIEKYKTEEDVDHMLKLFSVENITDLHTKVYVCSWEYYNMAPTNSNNKDYMIDLLKILSNTIKKQKAL